MTNPAPLSISDTKRPWRTAAAITALLLGFFALDRCAGGLLAFAYNHSDASPLVALRASGADTVVIGTSTAKYAFVSDLWPTKLINFAQDGQTVLFSIALARALAPQDNVKQIIIGVDPYDLNSGLSNPGASRVWRIAPIVGAFTDIAPILSDTRPTKAAALLSLSATWSYRSLLPQVLRGIGGKAFPIYQPLSAGPLFEPATPRSNIEQLQFSHSLDRYIEALARAARRPELQLTLVVTPAYQDDRNDQPHLLDELRRKLGDAPVCDLTRVDTPVLRELRSRADYFHDNIHLTEPGARVFTREINALISQRCHKAEISLDATSK